MSKLKEKRLELVMQTMKNRGIEHGGKCFMSLWGLAENLNNGWNAEHFCNTGKYKEANFTRYGTGKKLVLRDYQMSDMFRAIRGCLSSPLELRESYNNKSEYILWDCYGDNQ